MVPYRVAVELEKALADAGVRIDPVRPVQSLALNPELLEEVRRRRAEVLERIPKRWRSGAATLLDAILESAERVRRGITGGDPAVVNTLLSYTLAVMEGWGVHEKLVEQALRDLPELYDVVIDGESYVVVQPTEEEIKRIP